MKLWISIESGFIEQQIHRYCSFMAATCQILLLSLVSLAKANTGSFIPVLIDNNSTSDIAYHTDGLQNGYKGWRRHGISDGRLAEKLIVCGSEVPNQQEACGEGLQLLMWSLLATGLELSPGTKGGAKSRWIQMYGQEARQTIIWVSHLNCKNRVELTPLRKSEILLSSLDDTYTPDVRWFEVVPSEE